MSKCVYRVKSPDNPEVMVFINGMSGKTFFTKLWIMRIGVKIRKATHKAPGFICAYGGVTGFGEIIMVSYWQDKASLYGFMNTELHKKLKDYIIKNHHKFSSYNETYLGDPRSGAYIGDPRGLALVYA